MAVVGFAMVAALMTVAAGFFIIPILRKAMREDEKNTGTPVAARGEKREGP